MRDDVKSLLARQADWQRSRAKMPWGDKLRAAVAMRRGLVAVRKRPPHYSRRENASTSD